MPDMVDIRRTERAPDGMGGWNARGERVVYSGLPARVTKAQTQAMGNRTGRDIELEKWIIRLPVGTDVRERDLIDWEGLVIEVDEIKPRSWQTAITVSGEVVS